MRNLIDARAGAPGPWRMRGLAAAQAIVIVLLLAVVAAAAWWWFNGRTAATVGTGPATPGEQAAVAPTAAPDAEPANADLSVDQLYKEARTAMNDNRIVEPEGKSALEYYLRIVAKQPDDSGAKDALRELFPFATAGVEDQINQNNFDEANRIIGLLAQADPSNYTLTILRSKLDARRKQSDRDAAQKAAQEAAAAAAAAARTASTTPATTPGTAEAPASGTAPVPANTAAAGEPASTTEPASAPSATRPSEVARATPPPSAAPAATPAAPPAGGETREVRVLTAPRPAYPPAAVRNRQDGWVEVEFTVGADGSVQNAHVTASEPARVFDREAVRAVQQAKFEPALQNGRATATTLRRRIEFKLGG